MTNPVSVDGELEIQRTRVRYERLAAKAEAARTGFEEDEAVEALYRRLDEARDAYRTAILKHDPVVRGLVEALRRYVVYEQAFGYEILAEEFGPCEYPDSSADMEAWLDRVLREPARLAREAIGEGDQG